MFDLTFIINLRRISALTNIFSNFYYCLHDCLYLINRYQINMSEIRSQGEHEPLISEKRRYPEVFRWKVASIIVSVLITGFLIADIILLVDYNNNQPRANNFSFLADILKQTAKSPKPLTRQQFVNIATGLTTSFSDIWFQTADIAASWTSANPLNLDTVAAFFTGDTDHQLYILQMTDGTNTYYGAAYSHIGFPLPQSNYKTYLTDAKNQYFTFEIDERKSTLLGGGLDKNMPMTGSTLNLRNCNVLKLKQNSLAFLELLNLDFSANPPQFTLSATPSNSICFSGQPTPAVALTTLQNLLGSGAATTLTAEGLMIFHLSA